VNDTNEQIINDSYAALTDYYDRIGLARTDESDEIGWNTTSCYSQVLDNSLRRWTPVHLHRFQREAGKVLQPESLIIQPHNTKNLSPKGINCDQLQATVTAADEKKVSLPSQVTVVDDVAEDGRP